MSHLSIAFQSTEKSRTFPLKNTSLDPTVANISNMLPRLSLLES